MDDYITIDQLDYGIFSKLVPARNKKGRPKKHKKEYLDCVCRFDIETSRLPEIEQAFMYIWQFQIEDKCTVIGRTWEEFFTMLDNILKYIGDNWLRIYVHNLSFEFSFLKGVYEFDTPEVFRTEPRKVLKCTMFDHFEFRCSYYLTNLSLDKFLKQMNVENKKLTYDYNKIRYPWT